VSCWDVLLALFACAAPGAPAADDSVASPAEPPLAWDPPGTPGTATGTMDAATLAAELQAAIDDVPRFDPLVLMSAYDHLLRAGDATCPPISPDWVGQVYWEGDCVAESGAAYDGWVLSSWFRDVPGPYGEPCSDAAFFYGFATIVDPGGATWIGYGTTSYLACTDPEGNTRFDAYLEGDFTYGAAPEGSFLQDWLPVSLFWTATTGPAGHELSLDGAISGRAGAAEAVRFHDLLLVDGEPAGQVTLWDREGDPTVLEFEGDGDGCAGEVCVDWTVLTGWTDRPWY